MSEARSKVEVKQLRYNAALPVWAVVIDGQVKQCFMTEAGARQVISAMQQKKDAPTGDIRRPCGVTGGKI